MIKEFELVFDSECVHGYNVISCNLLYSFKYETNQSIREKYKSSLFVSRVDVEEGAGEVPFESTQYHFCILADHAPYPYYFSFL